MSPNNTSSAPRQSLAGRLIRWFLVLALVPLGLVTVGSSVLFEYAVEREVRADLSHLADQKVAAIEGYSATLEHQVTTLARSPGVVDAVRGLRGGAEPGPAAGRVRTFLAFAADSPAFTDLLLVAPDGTVGFASRETFPVGTDVRTGRFADSELARLVDRVKTLVQTDTSNFQTYPSTAEPGVPMAFVAAPVLNDGRVVGVLACRLDNDRLFRTLNDYGGLGTTGETVVVGPAADGVVFVAPTRHAPTAAFSRPVPADAKWAGELRAALAGSSGYGEGTDYRGESVVAAWRYLPTFGWGLVLKQDRAEAFAPVRRCRWIGLGMTAVLFPLVIAAAWAVARTITRPLRAAADTARSVAGGDLTVGRVTDFPDDEAGAVAGALGAMTAGLRELVGRIKDLSQSLGAMSAQLAATGRQQATAAGAFDGAAAEIVSAVRQIAATGDTLLVAMDQAGTAAAENAEVADAGRAGLAELGRAMGRLADGTAGIGRRLANIEDEAGRVSAVVATIADIADQTNLLSVNAAIEAEKAGGETGRGFRVVAREIRRLADRTGSSTQDVEAMVGRMGRAVAAGVGEMGRFSDEVRQGMTAADGIAADMAQIGTAANAAAVQFEAVRAGIRDQADATRLIDTTMGGLARGAKDAAAGAADLRSSAVHLRDAIAELDRLIARFRTAEPGHA